MLFGIIEFGRAINYWNDQNQLAESAARFAAVGVLPSSGSCPSEPSIVSYVDCEAGQDSNELANGSSEARLEGSQGAIGVCVSVPDNAQGQAVTVKVTSSFKLLPKLLGSAFTIPVGMSGEAQMRIESPLPASWVTTTGACP